MHRHSGRNGVDTRNDDVPTHSCNGINKKCSQLTGNCASDFNHFKIFFGGTAFGADPTVRNIGPAGTRRKPLLGQPRRLAIDKTTYHTQVFLVITHADDLAVLLPANISSEG